MKGTATPYGKTYAEHRRVMGLRQSEKVRIRKVKKELVKIFKQIFDEQANRNP